MSWWWSKNNCTIAMHDSRKKNYLCSWKEPKGDTSICLPYGRLSLLFITSGVLNSTFCSLHLSFCPLAGSWQLWVSRTLWSPLEQPYITCQQVLLSTWEWESRRIGFLQGANYMLSGAEGGAKHTWLCRAGVGWAPSRRLPLLLALAWSPMLW